MSHRSPRWPRQGAYNGVVFHRVIDGFMAQTGDVEYAQAGRRHAPRRHWGAQTLPNMAGRVFSDIPFDRGIVGMARSQNPNSANSQFFIMFAEGYFLNGQYTVVGRVIEGMDVIDAIKRGQGQSGSVAAPADVMQSVTVER